MATSACEQVNLSEMIDDIELLFTSECYISTPTETIDDTGGRTKTFTNSEIIPCRIVQISNREKLFNEKLLNAIGWSIKVPYATVVDATCRVIIGTTNYEVLGVKYSPSVPIYKNILAMEII